MEPYNKELLDYVKQDINDTTRCRVYADWLEENGDDHEYTAWIRQGCAYADSQEQGRYYGSHATWRKLRKWFPIKEIVDYGNTPSNRARGLVSKVNSDLAALCIQRTPSLGYEDQVRRQNDGEIQRIDVTYWPFSVLEHLFVSSFVKLRPSYVPTVVTVRHYIPSDSLVSRRKLYKHRIPFTLYLLYGLVIGASGDFGVLEYVYNTYLRTKHPVKFLIPTSFRHNPYQRVSETGSLRINPFTKRVMYDAAELAGVRRERTHYLRTSLPTDFSSEEHLLSTWFKNRFERHYKDDNVTLILPASVATWPPIPNITNLYTPYTTAMTRLDQSIIDLIQARNVAIYSGDLV